MFGGMPARAGVTAAELVSAGWNGVDDVFSGEDNFFAVNARNAHPALPRERGKVRYLPDPELAALLPARVAVVEVALRDGARLSERVAAVRGTVRTPMDRDEVVAKARDLMAPVVGSAASSGLIATLLAIDTNPDIRALGALLRQAQRAAPAAVQRAAGPSRESMASP